MLWQSISRAATVFSLNDRPPRNQSETGRRRIPSIHLPSLEFLLFAEYECFEKRLRRYRELGAVMCDGSRCREASDGLPLEQSDRVFSKYPSEQTTKTNPTSS